MQFYKILSQFFHQWPGGNGAKEAVTTIISSLVVTPPGSPTLNTDNR